MSGGEGRMTLSLRVKDWTGPWTAWIGKSGSSKLAPPFTPILQKILVHQITQSRGSQLTAGRIMRSRRSETLRLPAEQSEAIREARRARCRSPVGEIIGYLLAWRTRQWREAVVNSSQPSLVSGIRQLAGSDQNLLKESLVGRREEDQNRGNKAADTGVATLITLRYF
ncbi:hypothetical protein BDZ89DRAFT_1042371 [Hymenopellis radicata]|nr:hypothetical protein BDZ89DRAFT_1042371 [Hymenopellis radicata]